MKTALTSTDRREHARWQRGQQLRSSSVKRPSASSRGLSPRPLFRVAAPFSAPFFESPVVDLHSELLLHLALLLLALLLLQLALLFLQLALLLSGKELQLAVLLC